MFVQGGLEICLSDIDGSAGSSLFGRSSNDNSSGSDAEGSDRRRRRHDGAADRIDVAKTGVAAAGVAGGAGSGATGGVGGASNFSHAANDGGDDWEDVEVAAGDDGLQAGLERLPSAAGGLTWHTSTVLLFYMVLCMVFCVV